MADRSGAWERLDQPAATPRAAATSGGGNATRRAPLRLRRSRGPVLAALDGGGSVFQRRLRDVLVGSTLILAPAVGLNVWVTILAFNRLDPNDSAVPSFLTDDIGGGIEDVAWLVSSIFVSFVTAVVGFFCALILIGDRFRTPLTLSRALRRTLKGLPAIFVAWLLTHWWFVLGAVIIVSAESESAAGLLVVASPVMWFASAATLLVIPAMVGERLGPFAAAVRNLRLVRLRYGVCLVFVLVATLLSALMVTGIATLVPLLELTGFVDFGGIAWIVQGVMVQIAVLVVVPLIALGTAQVYVEVRLVGEGLDLVIDTDTAFGSMAPSGQRA